MDQKYTQSLELALMPKCGDSALEASALEPYLNKLAPALSHLKTAYDEGSLPLLLSPGRRDDIAQAQAALDILRRGAHDIILLGTGGSSLGGQALAQMAGWQVPGIITASVDDETGLHFLDNLDPLAMSALLLGLDLKTSRFIVISKSGTTSETLMQMLVVIEALKEAGLDWNLAQHFLCLTEPEAKGAQNALRKLCQLHEIPVLDHPDIGGRYTALSVVGIIPAMLMGLDPIAIREGAQSVIEPIIHGIQPGNYAPALGAALQAALLEERQVSTCVLMPYAGRLQAFTKWFVQLWSESLGKDGKGTTPIAASGPVDQHSQLQLFLDGPADKLVTIIMTDLAAMGPVVPQALANDPELGYLAGHAIGDLVDSQQRATAETLARNSRPVRVIHSQVLDEQTMGALLMHFMIETILMAHLLEVDPFDQPAVEEGKLLARSYLAGKT